MPKTKFGVGADVKAESGFGPYEGPNPKPGVTYPVELKQCSMKTSRAGNDYVNTLWEIYEGECKGYGAWHRIVPGESDMQQQRVAQFMQSVCGKNMADMVHDDIDEGGKVKTIDGKNPIGRKAGMTFYRKNEVRDGENITVVEPNDLYPGWVPKGSVPAARQPVEDDPWATPAPSATSAEADEVDSDEEELHTQEELQAMSLKDLKELVVSDYDLELPKGRLTKDKLIDLLVEEGYAEEADEDEEEAEEAAAPEPVKEHAPEPDEAEEDEDEEESDDEDEDPVALEDAEKMTLAQLKELATKWESELDLASFKGPKGKKALIAGLLEEEIIEDTASDEPPF